jgi:hypothetical protein
MSSALSRSEAQSASTHESLLRTRKELEETKKKEVGGCICDFICVYIRMFINMYVCICNCIHMAIYMYIIWILNYFMAIEVVYECLHILIIKSLINLTAPEPSRIVNNRFDCEKS